MYQMSLRFCEQHLKCSEGHVWVWDIEKCLPIVSQLHQTNKILKSVIGLLTVMFCLMIVLICIRERMRGAPEPNVAPVMLRTSNGSAECMELTVGGAPEPTLAPVILRTSDGSSECMELTGGGAHRLEDTLRGSWEEEGAEYVAFQMAAEEGHQLRDESHIYDIME